MQVLRFRGPWERCGFGESVQFGSLVFLGLKALNSKRGQGKIDILIEFCDIFALFL